MKITLDSADSRYLVQGYDVGQITVAGKVLSDSTLIMANQGIHSWPPTQFADLQAAHFQQLVDYSPEVVVLGTGKQLQFPAPAITQALIQARIGLEVMDTAAACRTYNVLLSEGRAVMAALIMIK